jgi:hypothetical protein
MAEDSYVHSMVHGELGKLRRRHHSVSEGYATALDPSHQQILALSQPPIHLLFLVILPCRPRSTLI